MAEPKPPIDRNDKDYGPSRPLAETSESRLGREPARRLADMDMRSGGDAGNGATEGKKRDAGFAQAFDQRAALTAIGMETDIHGIAMIEAQAIMSLGLPPRR